jgi:hypothetical protein
MRKTSQQTLLLLLFLTLTSSSVWSYDYADRSHITIAALKYGGGGDWYDSLRSIRNFCLFVQKNTTLKISVKEKVVSLLDDDLYLYPFLYINGHGNITFSDKEVERLRSYLQNGGFLFINDDYGLDPYIRREMKKVFPNQSFRELPVSHPIYNSPFTFPDGLPKIHQHDGSTPKGLGLFYEDRLVVFYAFEADIGDGWEEEWVHNDPIEARMAAMKMGVNILVYALTH